jgi:hypothetical protein
MKITADINGFTYGYRDRSSNIQDVMSQQNYMFRIDQ